MKKNINKNFHLRDTFFFELYNHFKKGNKKNFIVVTNDFGSPFLDKIIKEYPKYYLNAGVCEQNIITLSVGLAKEGFRPIVYSIASFLIYRAYEQIKLDMLVHNSPICLLTVGAGYAYDVDGPTHHSTEDLSVIYGLPNIKILSPHDNKSTKMSFREINNNRSPYWIRLDRGKFETNNKFINEKSFFTNFEKNKNLLVITTGTMLSILHKIKIESDLKFSILGIYKLKPLDKNRLYNQIKKFDKILILEEHNEVFGLYSLINDFLTKLNFRKKIKNIGLKDIHIFKYGKRQSIKKLHGLNDLKIKDTIIKLLK